MGKRYGVPVDPAWISPHAGSEDDGIVAVAGFIPALTRSFRCCNGPAGLLPAAGKDVRLAGSESYQGRSS
jgi:hypothetical protein